MQDRIGSRTGVGSPEGDNHGGVLRFSNLALDLDACTLKRESGEPVAVTRAEFALLRVFVQRPGRVLSRDMLLNAVSNRRMEPYDRSVDVLVSRLRQKVEPDPKQPHLIVTVPGEGYRFDGGPVERTAAAPPLCAGEQPWDQDRRPQWFGRLKLPVLIGGLVFHRAWLMAMAGLAIGALAAFGADWLLRPADRASSHEPLVAVLPFADLGRTEERDDFGRAVGEDLRTLLSTFPGIRVLSEKPPEAGSQAADFVLRGGILKSPDEVRVTAQLIDARTGVNVWADHFTYDNSNVVATQEAVAMRIANSVAGLQGSLRGEEERLAWQKAAQSLGEYDYYLRGSSYAYRPTCEDDMKAREIFAEGLNRYPRSALLRVELAFTYANAVEFYCSSDPRGDIERAWSLAREAMQAPDASTLTNFHGHWLMAALYEWREHDFARSIREAELAVQLAPYDIRSRAELSFYVANAGRLEQAAAWSATAARGSLALYGYQNLAWAYYLMGRHKDALDALEKSDPALPGYAQQLATIYVRLGRLPEAQATMQKWLEAKPRDSIALEANWPLKAELKAAYIDDLRVAGMPD